MRSFFPAFAAAAAALLVTQVSPGLAQGTAPTAPPAATMPDTTPPAATPPAAPPPAAASPGTGVPETTAPAAPALPSTTAPTPTKPRAHKMHKGGKRMSMAQRFRTANTAQDGHLTLDQARAARWPYAVRNFSAIDKGRKGYITEADIHAFAHARYLARHAAPVAPATSAPASTTAAPPPPPAQ